MGVEEPHLDDPRHQRALEWVTTPRKDREPLTQTAFAESLGIAPRTLRDWFGRDDFRRAWKMRVDSIVGSPERTQSALDRLYDAGMKEDNPNPERQLKLYFEVIKAITPPDVTVDIKSDRVRDLSNDQLNALIAAGAADVMRERNVR
jgi:hypothetical protein